MGMMGEEKVGETKTKLKDELKPAALKPCGRGTGPEQSGRTSLSFGQERLLSTALSPLSISHSGERESLQQTAGYRAFLIT